MALAINVTSIKALYRKAVALYHAHRYAEALAVLTDASNLTVDPLRNSLGIRLVPQLVSIQ